MTRISPDEIDRRDCDDGDDRFPLPGECGALPPNEPAVDTEAAAVWERLSKRARKRLRELARYQAGQHMLWDPDGYRIDRVDLVGLLDDDGLPNDLGRRVAAHGKALADDGSAR